MAWLAIQLPQDLVSVQEPLHRLHFGHDLCHAAPACSLHVVRSWLGE